MYLLLAGVASFVAALTVIEGMRVGGYLWLSSLFATATGFYLAERV